MCDTVGHALPHRPPEDHSRSRWTAISHEDNGVDMSDRGGSLRWLFWPSLLVSVALHIGAVVALLLLQDERSGAVAQPTQAISVNIETTEVLQSVEQAPSMTAAAGQAAPVPPEELKPEDKPEDQLPEPEPPAETPKEQPKPVEADQPPPE